MTAFCVSLPVPAGVFFPIFVLGAAYGRLLGEAMTSWFPDGIHEGQNSIFIQPGREFVRKKHFLNLITLKMFGVVAHSKLE